MEQDVYRLDKNAQDARHASPQELRSARRKQAGAFALAFVAILLGVAAGVLWLNHAGLPNMEPVAQSTPRPAPDAVGEDREGATELPAFVQSDGAADDDAPEVGDATEPGDIAGDIAGESVQGRMHLAGQLTESFGESGQATGSATSIARIQEVMSARAPTPTATPVPFLGQLDAVIALGGADLWDADSGLLLGRLGQGALFAAYARSNDGRWLLGTTTAGASGWVAVEQVIAFDTSRLRSRPEGFVPITPTPAVVQVLIPTPTPHTGEAPKGGSAPDADMAAGAPAVPALPSEDAGPVARISLTDSRLNVRAGPGPHHPIVTKAHPDELFRLIGLSAQGDWVQVAVSDVQGGFGWALADYVEIRGELDAVPVSTAVNDAPPYVEGAENERVRQQRAAAAQAHTTAAQLPVATRPKHVRTGAAQAGVIQASAVQTGATASGLQGKLTIQTSWGGDIFLYNFADNSLRLLTGGFDPALSPDGTQVAFTRGGGEHGLYLIHVDGSNERLIFGGRELLRSPSWSPDGRWIVFERGDEFTDCRDVGRRCPRDQQPRPGYPAGIFRQPMLARVDVNGANYRDLGVLQSAQTPDWSTHGIVYASAAGIQVTQDLPDTVTQEVFFQIQKQYEMSPALQPGGHTVLFQRREASHWEIYRVNLDGSGLRHLTNPSFTLVRQLPANVAPAWSPDGQHIAFLSNRQPDQEAGDWAIWVMDADGGNQRRLPIDLPLTYTYVGERMLSWSR